MSATDSASKEDKASASSVLPNIPDVMSALPDLSGAFKRDTSVGSTSERTEADTGATSAIYQGTKVNVSEDAKKFIMEDSTQEMVKYALMAIGALALLRALASTMVTFGVIACPFIYVYLVQTCPKPESFDSKTELKKILQGNHLPEEHPDKPKGYFGKLVAQASASITAESTLFFGCQQELIPYWGGAVILANVKVPSKEIQVYWIGAAGEWRYMYTKPLATEPADKKKD